MVKFFIVVYCFVCIFLVGCGDTDKKKEFPVSNINPQTVQSSVVRKNTIPKGFKPVNVLNKVMYVPEEFKPIDVSYKITAQGSDSGMALVGSILKKDESIKDKAINFYDVHVGYEKHDELRNMKSYEEAEVLEVIFKNYWESFKNSGKLVTKKDLISKQICENLDGHLYLKVDFTSGNPNKPKLNKSNVTGIYIFDNTIYFVSLGQLVRGNGRHNKDFDIILNAFGCDLK